MVHQTSRGDVCSSTVNIPVFSYLSPLPVPLSCFHPPPPSLSHVDMGMGYVPGPIMYPGMKMRGSRRGDIDYHGPGTTIPFTVFALYTPFYPLPL